MNLSHTVGDLRNFIDAHISRGQLGDVRPYSLRVTFPPRRLDDDSATMKGAGIENSVIVQRWS